LEKVKNYLIYFAKHTAVNDAENLSDFFKRVVRVNFEIILNRCPAIAII